MENNIRVCNVDIEISNLTGVTPDVVRLILAAQELVILNKVLEIQLAEEEIDYCELGNFMLTDATDYKNIALVASTNLKQKINEVVKSGRDFLAESIVLKFNSELISKYNDAYAADSVFEHDSVIDIGDGDE